MIRAVLLLALVAAPAWAQQQPDPLDQAVAAQFQALATQLGNASEAVQKLIDSRKKLQAEMEAQKQPSLPPAGTGAPKP